jgi:hypothetical protein
MFIVGKKYQGRFSNNVYECLYADETGGLLGNGKIKFWGPSDFFKSCYKEYKEPVVHKRYVHWYYGYNEILSTSTGPKKEMAIGKYPVIKIDEVTYVEENK